MGATLVRRLVASDYRVRVLDNLSTGDAAHLAGVDAELVKGDIRDEAALDDALEGMGAIIHLAAMVPKAASEDQARAAFAANLTGTIHLFDAFGRVGQANTVASTAEVYGLPAGHEPISEDTEPCPLSWYGASKVAAEVYCRVLERHDQMRIAILRFTVLYGTGDTNQRAIPNFVRSAVRGEAIRIHGGEELRDYLHVDDAARAVTLAWEHRISGTYNVGSGKGISVRDAAAAVLRVAGSDKQLEEHPRQKPAADIVLDVTRFREATGFAPARVFPDGLEEQIASAAAADARL